MKQYLWYKFEHITPVFNDIHWLSSKIQDKFQNNSTKFLVI